MYKKLSKSDEIIARLATEQGALTETETDNYLAETRRINNYMEDVREDFNLKDRMSQISASKSMVC